ncbi:MAG: hypothetical protein L6R41_004196, partial [Letrouitia leprolyta]
MVNAMRPRRPQTSRHSTTPHIDFLNNLRNFLPLGVLILPSDDESTLETRWEEYYPEYIHDNSTLANEAREFHQPVWALLCLGWLRTFARRHPQDVNLVQVRFYILPSDVGGRYVERNAKDWERVKVLMRYLDVSAEAWAGTKDLDQPKDNPIEREPHPENNDSLFYIFNTLPSPKPFSFTSYDYSSHAISSLLNDTESILGLRTELYAYQRRSAAVMIQREAQPARALDPRLEEINCPIGGIHFYDRTTGAVFRYPKYYEEAKGGILAETMGLGKTLICLAAILATKGHWPQIPPQYSLERRPIRSRVGSLMDMAAAAANQEQIPWRSHFQRMSSQGDNFDNCRRVLEQNVPSYTIPPPEARRSRRPTTERPGQTIGLCATTLVVVPLNLFSHWRNEIATHVEDGVLDVLYIDSNEVLMPSARELQSYDIILLTKARLEEEMSLTSSLKNRCSCVETVRCCCSAHSNAPYSSPLSSLHFLRIIVDEGHDFSSFSRKSNAVFALQSLHVDRRWIVSGTPSSGLLGVEASTATLESLSGVSDRDSLLVREILESRRSRGADLCLEPGVRKSALLQERKDLEKLGSIVVDFLDLRPWANGKEGNDIASWRQYILPNEQGQRKPQSLRKVLETLVIRHRIEDVEKDIKLPPLHNRTVYLEPKWHDKLSLNLFIMNLAVNAVTSERVDQDYMFHPKNRASLNQLITNLRYSGFYWTAFTQEEVSKSIEVSRKYLEDKCTSDPAKERSGNLRDGDFDFLRRAIHTGETVLACPSWRAFSAAHELGLYINDFPQDAREAWSLAKDTPGKPLITGAPQMSKAQHFIDTHLYATDPASGLDVLGKTTMDKLWQSVQTKPAKTTKDKNDTVSPQSSPLKRGSAPASTSIQKPPTMGKHTISRVKASSSPRKDSNQDGYEPRTNDKPAMSNIQPQPLKSALKSSSKKQKVEPFEPGSVLSKTRLSGTASAKLSYLLDRITVLH